MIEWCAACMQCVRRCARWQRWVRRSRPWRASGSTRTLCPLRSPTISYRRSRPQVRTRTHSSSRTRVSQVSIRHFMFTCSYVHMFTSCLWVVGRCAQISLRAIRSGCEPCASACIPVWPTHFVRLVLYYSLYLISYVKLQYKLIESLLW